MGITFTIPPREEEPVGVRRCRLCGSPFGEDGLPICNFLHGREVVMVNGGSE